MKSKKGTVNSSDQKELFMVGTPIGNLTDISLRAMEVFETVEWVAAEDTRQARKLFTALKVKNKPEFHSVHAHSSESEILKLLDRVSLKRRGAYVSDAGTPGLSDPGAKLVDLAARRGWRTVPVPGASALTAIASILNSKFQLPLHFHGFYPRQQSDRATALSLVNSTKGTHIFFESPRRITSVLESLLENENVAQLPITIGRELTKLHEEVLRGSVAEILESIRSKEVIKGEFVFALASPDVECNAESLESKPLVNLVMVLHDRNVRVDQKTFVAMAKSLGWKRNEAYELSLTLQRKGVVDKSAK